MKTRRQFSDRPSVAINCPRNIRSYLLRAGSFMTFSQFWKICFWLARKLIQNETIFPLFFIPNAQKPQSRINRDSKLTKKKKIQFENPGRGGGKKQKKFLPQPQQNHFKNSKFIKNSFCLTRQINWRPLEFCLFLKKFSRHANDNRRNTFFFRIDFVLRYPFFSPNSVPPARRNFANFVKIFLNSRFLRNGDIFLFFVSHFI